MLFQGLLLLVSGRVMSMACQRSLQMLLLWASLTARQSIVVTCPGSTNLGLLRW